MSQHDMIIDNGPGLAVRQDINAAIQALVQNNSGPVEPATMYPGQFWLDTSVPPNGLLRQRNQSNTGWIAPTTAAEILPFLNADLSFLARTGPNRFVWNSKADGTGTDLMALDENGMLSVLGDALQPTALARNRVVNGAFQVSQENGNTVGSVNGYYGADQWMSIFATTATIGIQRVQVLTPNGSQNRYRVATGTADTSLATGDVLAITQRIEGSRIADFKWGGASARQVVLRFGWKSPAGTYAVALQNTATATRSYIAPFTISAGQANTDTEQVLVIPGDVAGGWASDTSVGIQLWFTVAAGATYHGVAGWQAGNFISAAALSNGLGVAGNTFELYDVGIYLDPDSTGLPPKWQMPDEAEELRACQRYYYRSVWHHTIGALAAAAPVATTITFQVAMRVAPAMTDGGGGTAVNVASVGVDSGSVTGCRAYSTATAAGQVAISNRNLTASARM